MLYSGTFEPQSHDGATVADTPTRLSKLTRDHLTGNHRPGDEARSGIGKGVIRRRLHGRSVLGADERVQIDLASWPDRHDEPHGTRAEHLGEIGLRQSGNDRRFLIEPMHQVQITVLPALITDESVDASAPTDPDVGARFSRQRAEEDHIVSRHHIVNRSGDHRNWRTLSNETPSQYLHLIRLVPRLYECGDAGRVRMAKRLIESSCLAVLVSGFGVVECGEGIG